MRPTGFKIKLFLFVLITATARLAAQTDTTVYQITDVAPLPMLTACQPAAHPGWTADSVRRCAERQLLALVAQNVRYPEEARRQNLEGTVVTTFVVEPSGRISNLAILRDIGGGCGAEALRVLRGLDEAGLRWLPGQSGGKTVRASQTLPLRFRLTEALPYVINEYGDSLYVTPDTAASFLGDLDSLDRYLLNRVEYPAAVRDSCRTGIIEMSLIVRPDGSVFMSNQLDFNNLGYDFQWNAMRLINRTAGMWTPAQYAGKPVASSLPVRVMFKSPAPGCATANADFDRAMLLAEEAVTLIDAGKNAEAIVKLSEALRFHPDNTELLYYRGTIFLNENRREEACQDYNRIKKMLGVTWFEDVRRLVCGW